MCVCVWEIFAHTHQLVWVKSRSNSPIMNRQARCRSSGQPLNALEEQWGWGALLSGTSYKITSFSLSHQLTVAKWLLSFTQTNSCNHTLEHGDREETTQPTHLKRIGLEKCIFRRRSTAIAPDLGYPWVLTTTPKYTHRSVVSERTAAVLFSP